MNKITKRFLKDTEEYMKKSMKEEVHYTTVVSEYDYSDGLSFSTIESFRTKFPADTEVEVIVRPRKVK